MYPIRTNRPLWSKCFFKNHICTEVCNTEYELIDRNFRFSFRTSCMYPQNIEPINIHLSKYTDFIDTTVIIPTNVKLLFHHPFNKPIIKEYSFETTPVLMSEILKVFDTIYKELYKDEEEHTTEKTYNLENPCVECKDEDYSIEHIDQYITQTTETTDSCNICFEEGDENNPLIKINRCNHIYHKKCLLNWYNTPKTLTDGDQIPFSNSCPNCRKTIIYCQNCDGNLVTRETFVGKIPPYIPGRIRVETDGPYQIHSFYYEDLSFKGIMFNTTTKILSLLPFQ